MLKEVRKFLWNIKMDAESKKYPFDKIKPVFLVSTGRTGTMFFKDYFDKHHSHICSKHEPFPDLQDAGIKYFNSSLETKIREFKRHRALINKNLIENNFTYYLESNNKLSPFLEAIKYVYQDYRIIHIVRNPKDLIRSFMIEHTLIKGAKVDIPVYSSHDLRPRLTPDLFESKENKLKWLKADRFEKLCWYWSTYNNYILDQINDDPKAITVKFEDVFFSSNNHRGFSTIIEFLSDYFNIEQTQELSSIFKVKSNSSAKNTIPKYVEWSTDQKDIFHTQVDSLAKKLNYF